MEKYLNPLLKQGKLKWKYPDNHTHPKQKYIWAKCKTDSVEPPSNTCAQLSIAADKLDKGEKHDND